ncbi:ABC transporter ATP-binding protein [Vreelandella olivaria]|uniref:ABC transporter ATP-binding protein n=1 Tax=Vreelandella olivaria TaxID=390919 RepID=UPI00201F9669|nr:ABC transporter ATP-binding protein [Halomonas olivaria]
MSELVSFKTAEKQISAPLMDPRIAVQLDGVLKQYGDSTALHRISLKIFQGEFLTLLGPSGCGKTTLLNLMAGFIEADNGEIFIDGELVTETPPYQREIGIVFQSYALFPHMNVRENVGYGLRMRRVPKTEIQQRVEQALKMVKLEGYGERRPKELSGGQQQRVALARALVIRPKVLLLDEPFSALDKNLRLNMQQEIKEIQRKLGVTTVFVTHDQDEALAMSDRVVVMSAGHVRQVATPHEIYRHPIDPFVASFVGDANIFPARYTGHDNSTGVIEFGSTKLHLPIANIHGQVGDVVDLYARPENIRLVPLNAEADLAGTVIGHVFQGDHVDVSIHVPDCGMDHPVTVRSSGLDALDNWSTGSGVGIRFVCRDTTAFTRVSTSGESTQ